MKQYKKKYVQQRTYFIKHNCFFKFHSEIKKILFPSQQGEGVRRMGDVRDACLFIQT